MADRSSDMTLAFTLPALKRLADPGAAVEDAREWTEHVGAVATEPNGAVAYTRERRIRLDFFSGTRTPAETLQGLRLSYDTDRYVLVGVDGQADLAESCGWEFQHVEDAADRAGWRLGDGEGGGGSGALGRVLGWLRGGGGGKE